MKITFTYQKKDIMEGAHATLHGHYSSAWCNKMVSHLFVANIPQIFFVKKACNKHNRTKQTEILELKIAECRRLIGIRHSRRPILFHFSLCSSACDTFSKTKMKHLIRFFYHDMSK